MMKAWMGTAAGFGLVLLVAACSLGPDTNRPDTYGDHCAGDGDCESPFKCLGPANAGPYWPICTVPCSDASSCPVWEANGHCEGRITPTCSDGFCDYARCE